MSVLNYHYWMHNKPEECKLDECLSVRRRLYEDRKPTKCYIDLLNLQFAQHVSGTIMPIIRSLKLYRLSRDVAHNLGYNLSLVWCVVVVYASGLRDFMPIIRSLRLYR
jgi:hypothetical protein